VGKDHHRQGVAFRPGQQLINGRGLDAKDQVLNNFDLAKRGEVLKKAALGIVEDVRRR
jgi:hypothetical protein